MTDVQGQARPKRPKRPTRPAPEPVTQAESQQAEAAEAAITALVEAETGENPIAVFTDKARYRALYEKVEGELRQLVPDVTTDKGRRAIKANAFRAVKVKTTLDKHRKSLTEASRQLVNTVNAAGKEMEAELDALAKELRKPLTDWEIAEDARIEANEAVVAKIRADMIVTEDDTSVTVEARGRAIHALEFPSPQWTDEEAAIAEDHKADAVDSLHAARDRLAKAEKDARELEELRAAEAARQERERIAQLARDAAEEATREAAAAEEARKQAEREEEERLEAAAFSAAQAAREKAEAEKQREIDAALEQAAQAEREAEQLRNQAAEEKRKRDEEAEAQRQRDTDQEHRNQVMADMESDLRAVSSVTAAQAKAIVSALVADRISNTKVAF